MVTDRGARLWSDLAIPPGEMLQEELDTIGMTQKELASRTGRPSQVINEIVQGKKAITSETALELEKVLGIPAHIWVNLEASYRLTLARNQERQRLVGQETWLKDFPVLEMEKRRWIPHYRDKIDKVRALLGFLGVTSFDALEQSAVSFRITGGSHVSVGALAVWLRKGELEGREIQTQPFSSSLLKKTLPKIRGLTAEHPKEFFPKITQLCAEAGVAVVCIPELPRSGANGVAKWFSQDKALIQLSLRWRWSDIFWFTFFHEVYHVLSQQVQKVYIEGIRDGINGDPQVESQADAFARDLLIPQGDWARFVQARDWSPFAVQQFAREIGIAPGIVVGRMQHKQEIIPYNRLANLKTRFIWSEEAKE